MISITFLSIVTLGLLSTVDAFTSNTQLPTASCQPGASYYSRNIAVSLVPSPSDLVDASSILYLVPTPSDFVDASSILHHVSTQSSFADTSSILLVKFDAKTTLGHLAKKAMLMMPPAMAEACADVTAHVLNDASHALMDFPSVFQKVKTPKLHMRYAQVAGRLMLLGTGMLPHHGFTPEEVVFQLFLLGASMKPVVRSSKLVKCIGNARCAKECTLELEDLEDSLP
uniref:Uncharacterized protein n=1 Tax=Pseudo-nitzschia australis TaxID=44445 RepID=A0A7S4ALZ2_9STRA|mmetsp:Transcript_1237/g.2813  ORF Transcript_1237/g.2813 Transcript_1237/m.2813 type:complete len:227 (+) Transcript_1237:172-852(+)